MFDSDTFGNSKAARDLISKIRDVDSIKKQKEIVYSIGLILTNVNIHFKELKKLQRRTRLYIGRMFLENRLKYINNTAKVPAEYKSYVRNLTYLSYRKHIFDWKTKNKITYLSNLPLKSSFEIVGLEDYYRNLVLIHSNESGCLIRGETLEDEVWKKLPFNYIVSTSTRVRKLNPEEVRKRKELI